MDSAPKTVRILIVDDHEAMRKTLRMVMGAYPDIEVVGEGRDGGEAVDAAARLRPDVVLMDVSLPVIDGLEAARRIKAAQPGVRVILLSMYERSELDGSLAPSEADAFLPKSGSVEELVAAVRG